MGEFGINEVNEKKILPRHSDLLPHPAFPRMGLGYMEPLTAAVHLYERMASSFANVFSVVIPRS